jgi:hypothetical protein
MKRSKLSLESKKRNAAFAARVQARKRMQERAERFGKSRHSMAASFCEELQPFSRGTVITIAECNWIYEQTFGQAIPDGMSYEEAAVVAARAKGISLREILGELRAEYNANPLEARTFLAGGFITEQEAK